VLTGLYASTTSFPETNSASWALSSAQTLLVLLRCNLPLLHLL